MEPALVPAALCFGDQVKGLNTSCADLGSSNVGGVREGALDCLLGKPSPHSLVPEPKGDSCGCQHSSLWLQVADQPEVDDGYS